MEISATQEAIFHELKPLHCDKDALTNFFGWILQIILAGIAFSCLIGIEKLFSSLLAMTLINISLFFSQKIL
jgi:hypothetical protein